MFVCVCIFTMPYGMLKICFILCLLLNMQIQMQMYYFELFRFILFYLLIRSTQFLLFDKVSFGIRKRKTTTITTATITIPGMLRELYLHILLSAEGCRIFRLYKYVKWNNNWNIFSLRNYLLKLVVVLFSLALSFAKDFQFSFVISRKLQSNFLDSRYTEALMMLGEVTVKWSKYMYYNIVGYPVRRTYRNAVPKLADLLWKV